MRVNITLPLPRSFKYELDKRTGPLREELYKSSPHYLWLDKEEWRLTLGFYGKLDNVIDVELVCMAVEQAVFGFGPIVGVTGRFKILPDDGGYYGNRNIVGLTFKKGNDRMAELSNIIAEKMKALLSNKYIQFTRPYITLARKGRRRRPCLPVGRVGRLELSPLECVFDKVTLYISDKCISGTVYVLQKSARLV